MVFETVFERGLDRFAADAGIYEIGNGMHKGVFITDDVTGRPPLADVGMDAAGLGHENIAKAFAVAGIGVVEELEAIHVFEVEAERALGAVDFDFDVVLAAQGEAGGFEVGKRAVLKAADEHGGIVHGDFAHFLGGLGGQALAFATGIHEGTFLDEGMHQAAYFLKFADEIAGKVNDVGIDIAMRAGATDAFLQTPDERKLGIDNPILRIAGVIMVDLTDGTFLDHFFGLGNGGDAAVVVANHVDHFGLLYSSDHVFALFDGQAERFFAEDVLAGAGGGDGDFGVGIIGCVDVHDVDVRRVDDGTPIRGDIVPAELGAGGFDPGGIASADGMHFDVGLEREEMGRLTPGVRVGLAHEAVADHADT